MRWTSLAIAASILLHAAVYRLFTGPVWKPAPPPEPIAIEIRERPPEGNPDADPLARKRGKKNTRAMGLPLSAFRRPFDMKGAIASGMKAQFDTEAKGSAEWSNEHWGVRGGSLKEAEHYISYYLLQREIQGTLSYPAAMGVRDISGTISARITFNEGSKCDKKRSWARGHHHYLRFYVMALIHKVCGLGNIEHMHFQENQFVDMNFIFLIAEGKDIEVLEKRDNVTGNVLTFQRIYPKAWYEWQLGPFRGVYGVPFVFLDYPWVLDKWEKWVEGHDPLDSFR